MAKVTEPKNFVELQAKYTARLAEVSAEFRLALASSKPATIADRIRRSAMTTSCLYDGAADAARLMYGGQPNNSYDIATQLYSTLQREIKKYFDERPPAGTKSDGKTFPDVEAVQAAAAELRRVTAEAAVTFQTLESQPHITLDGGCIREQVVRLAAKSVKWAALTSALPKVILDTLLLHRKSPAYASWQDHRMLAMAREALKMLVSLTLPDARESMLQAQVVKPYLQQLQTCFKGKFTVKQILEIGKTTMKSEIVMAEFTFASFIPKIGETVKSELQKLLLVDNAKRIAEDREYGAMATLLKPLVHADEFAALVTLLDFDEGAVQCIDEAVMVAVAEAVTALLAKPKYAENFINAVPSLIKLAAEYRLTVSVQHTTNDLRHRFCVSVQAGVMSALDDNGSFEEAFVNIIDGVLKEKRATPDTRGERLMALLDGLSLIRDPALFVAFYKRQLATRLLLRPYVSLTLEKTTLDGIESRLGHTALRHLRVMLNEVNKASASPSPANGGPSDAVWCSEYVWPTGDLNRMLLPPAISALCQDALQRQSAVPQYARHVFTIDPTLTVVELKYRPRKDGHTCLVRCCAAQAAVLMTVAAAGSQGIDVDAIARALTCSVNSVLFILKSITGGLLMVNDVSGRCVIQEGYMDGATQDHKLALPSLVSAKRRPTITTTHIDPAANDLSPPTSDGSAGGWFQQIARIRELLRLRRSQQ